MNYLCWIAIGVLAGFGAGRLSNLAGPTYLVDVLVGIAGATLGGAACLALAGGPWQHLDGTALVAACLAAMFALRGLYLRFPRKTVLVVKPSKRWH